MLKGKLVAFAMLSAFGVISNANAEKVCVHIDSYHEGYEWSDGLSKGLDTTLKGKCKVERFRMDTKRNAGPDFAKKAGEDAKKFIEDKKADIVIVSDDNAVKFMVMPFFKDAKLPVVFIGINWTIDQYGLPYKNTTGMIEVWPIQPMLTEVKKALPNLKTAVFLSMDNETEAKELSQVEKIFKANKVEVKPMLIKTFEEWKAKFIEAQSADLVLVSNNAGIAGWDKAAAADFAMKNTKKLTVSIYDFMGPYVAAIFAKEAYEQGEWGGNAAAKILEGKAPNSIPVVTNKRHEAMVNQGLMAIVPTKLSAEWAAKAKPIK
jgi:ABC-type uncharacterized transport system substrate-binding protein